MTFNSKDKQ